MRGIAKTDRLVDRESDALSAYERFALH
jgi:hypothetical protein